VPAALAQAGQASPGERRNPVPDVQEESRTVLPE
jgi:hypothetical protein